MQHRFISSTILENEQLVYFTRPHWIVFVPAIFLFLMSLLFYIYGPGYFALQSKILGYTLYKIGALIIFLCGLYALISALIMYYTSEYALTDKRVLMKTGWIQRNSLEIFLRKLEAINVNQSILGRLLNYGTIIIIGTGGTEDFYVNVPDPLGFRRRVQEQAEKLTDADDIR